LIELGLTLHSTHHTVSHFRNDTVIGHMSKHWRRVVRHPGSSHSHQAHLTMLQ